MSEPTRGDIFKLLESFFGSDLKGRIKCYTWFNTNNPLLGNVSPKHMFQQGRGDKLKKFIVQQLAGNNP